MTGQISDSLFYKQKEYSIVGVKGKALFKLEDYGVEPSTICSACWRGYVATYAIRYNKLVLRDLELLLSPEEVREVGIHFLANRNPTSHDMGPIYKRLNVLMDFSGKLLIGRDFIPALYVHMGFQKPYTYSSVHEFSVSEGKVIEHRDVSTQMELIREELKTKPNPADWKTAGDLIGWIGDSFSLDFDI